MPTASPRRFLLFFSGEDEFIISKCDTSVQNYFKAIGLLVLLISVICWTSAVIFMCHVFAGSEWLSVPIAMLWATLVINLYLLLLYTISPGLLPVAQKKRKDAVTAAADDDTQSTMPLLLRFSFLTRTGFIVFLAIIVSQPINVLLFVHDSVQANQFATCIRSVLHTQPLAWLSTLFFCIVMLLPVVLKYKIRAVSARKFEKDFEGADAGAIRMLRELLGSPDKHQRVSELILSIDMNTVRTSDFYFQKALIEYRVILEEYRLFKRAYAQLLSERVAAYSNRCTQHIEAYLDTHAAAFSQVWKQSILAPIEADVRKERQLEQLERYEYWADPPFRTTHRYAARGAAGTSDLLRLIYPPNEG